MARPRESTAQALRDIHPVRQDPRAAEGVCPCCLGRTIVELYTSGKGVGLTASCPTCHSRTFVSAVNVNRTGRACYPKGPHAFARLQRLLMDPAARAAFAQALSGYDEPFPDPDMEAAVPGAALLEFIAQVEEANAALHAEKEAKRARKALRAAIPDRARAPFVDRDATR